MRAPEIARGEGALPGLKARLPRFRHCGAARRDYPPVTVTGSVWQLTRNVPSWSVVSVRPTAPRCPDRAAAPAHARPIGRHAEDGRRPQETMFLLNSVSLDDFLYFDVTK